MIFKTNYVIPDSSVWIDFTKNRKTKEVDILLNLMKDKKKIGLNSIIYMELLRGCKTEKDVEKTKLFLSEFKMFIPTHKTYLTAVQVYKTCRKSGHTIKSIDCLIASFCIDNNFELLYKDKHFDFIAMDTGRLKTLTG